MQETEKHTARMASITLAEVFPHYVTKVEKKGRSVDDLYQVIEWLTGFDQIQVQKFVDEKVTFKTFFDSARLNENAEKITGVICAYRIEDIQNPLTRNIRYLDKLVDELAKGRKMDKILRK